MQNLIPFMKEKWQPKALEFEEPKQFESDWQPDPRFPHPVNNIISMFYSLEKLMILRKNMKKKTDSNMIVL